MSKYIKDNENELPIEGTIEEQLATSLGFWPCKWVSCADVGKKPFVTAYRLIFNLDKPEIISVRVSADERYKLYLDGIFIGLGSQRGDRSNWFYETYDLKLDAGRHVIVAQTWSFGEIAPSAQIMVYSGFILCPEQEVFIELLGTGLAKWEAKKIDGYGFEVYEEVKNTGPRLIIDGKSYSWGFESGRGKGWKPVINKNNGLKRDSSAVIYNNHIMRSRIIPSTVGSKVEGGIVRYVEQLSNISNQNTVVNLSNNLTNEVYLWNDLLQGKPLIIPPNTIRRVIIDLNDYYCAYPEIVLSKGQESFLSMQWAESLYYKVKDGKDFKGNRNVIEGKYFIGYPDKFFTDGGIKRHYNTLWWRCGRYIEIVIETKQQELIIEAINFVETRYPLFMESSFDSSDNNLQSIIPLLIRSIQICANETYMDTPYYEQLQWVGDIRIEALVSYVISKDTRLQKSALEILTSSVLNYQQLVPSIYPKYNSGIPSVKYSLIIPSYSLWWVQMVYDYALWKGETDFILSIMPSVRMMVDLLYQDQNELGLVNTPRGWNFYDWTSCHMNEPCNKCSETIMGLTEAAYTQSSGLFNWQMVLILNEIAYIERYLKQYELEEWANNRAEQLCNNIDKVFWDEEKGLYADTTDKKCFSQHTQSLAILSERLNKCKEERVVDGLINNETLVKPSIYFIHYIFEAYYAVNLGALILENLQPWFDLVPQGFKATPELFSKYTRSDSHGWGAHPLYHYFCSVLGIRPNSFGFETVIIKPQLGTLKYARGTLTHTKGDIITEYYNEVDVFKAIITLPQGLCGTFIYKDKKLLLCSGVNKFIFRT